MQITFIVMMIAIPFFLLFIYLFVLVIRALLKYIKSKEISHVELQTRKNLGEVLKQQRISHKMTQEYVAEVVGVSRQAVSKWENGASDPSTSNLIALSKLYEISFEDLLREVK